MKSINLKRLILPNLPYLLFVYLFDKVGQAARLAPGADFSGKLLSIGDGFAAAFSSFAPSLHPADLLVGAACPDGALAQGKCQRAPGRRTGSKENNHAEIS